MNPASSVRGPKHVVKRGKTPVLSSAEARELLDSIDLTELVGLRDRALIGLMVYSFARVGAAVAMDVEDYFQQGKRCWFRLHEKGGKRHDVPAHHNAEAYLDAYVRAAGIATEKDNPLFRTIDRHGNLTVNRMSRNDALRMVKRRAAKAGLPASISCHTFRATGITAYLENGGTIDEAQPFCLPMQEYPALVRLDRPMSYVSFESATPMGHGARTDRSCLAHSQSVGRHSVLWCHVPNENGAI